MADPDRTIPPHIPRVRTPRLLLRPPGPADADALLRTLRDSEAHLSPWSPLVPEGRTLEMHVQAEIARARDALAAGTACRLIAFDPENPALVRGGFNLNNISRGVFQNADAGWWLAADATGRGLAAEGLLGLLDLAFAPPGTGLGLHRVQANIMPRNARSLALAERCGFRREGLAMAMLRIAGRWEDHINFAKLADEHAPSGAQLAPAPPTA